MADVKFMDISENDNPATTDSVLVANKENGVKRTTLGDIQNLFKVTSIVHTEQVKIDLSKTNGNYTSVVAPNVSGYTFLFWINPFLGNVPGYVHMDQECTNNVGNLYMKETGTAGSDSFVGVTAVYIRSEFA